MAYFGNKMTLFVTKSLLILRNKKNFITLDKY